MNDDSIGPQYVPEVSALMLQVVPLSVHGDLFQIPFPSTDFRTAAGIPKQSFEMIPSPVVVE